MRTPIPPNSGFSPENIERIYNGVPALVGPGEKAAVDVPSDA